MVAGRKKISFFGCSARHAKGPSVCANALTVSEGGLNAAVLAALGDYFRSPNFSRWMAEAQASAKKARAKSRAGEGDLEAAVRLQQARVDRLVEAVTKLGLYDTLAEKLNAERARLLDAKRALAASAPRPGTAERHVTAEQVAVLASRLEQVARLKPERAKEALSTVLRQVTMTPTPAGGYRAVWPSRAARPPWRVQGGRLDEGSCGGRI